MKPRLLLLAQVMLLVLVAVFAGSATGRLVPLLSGTPAEAADLDVTPLAPLAPVGGGVTYQGRLKNGGNPAGGSYDFTFKLYDAPTLGSQVGSTISPTIVITDGLFTTALDFGAGAFRGDARYLETAVRPTGGGGYTTLTPRQPITPAPYALFALDTPGYDNVVVVAKSGGDFTEIQAALNSITDNSSTNRYLVWVGPGDYTEQVTMKPYVDVEGAGEATTRITWTGSAFELGGTVGPPNAGTMSGGTFGVEGGFWGAAAPQPTPDGVIMGHVTWQGIPQPDSRNAAMPAVLSLCVGGTPVTYNTTTDSSGYFTVTTGLAGGVYNWSLKGQMHLAGSGSAALERWNVGTLERSNNQSANAQTFKPSNVSTTSVEMGLMRAGDANGDNMVEALDFNMLKASFGTAVGDPQFNGHTDFNRDGTVEVLDFTLLKGNFGQSGAALTCP